MNEKLNIMQKEVIFWKKKNHFYNDKSNPRL